MQTDLRKQHYKEGEMIVTMRIKKKIVELVDSDREQYSTPRSSWIVQAIINRLERSGYEVK
jgi:hypothetical protein